MTTEQLRPYRLLILCWGYSIHARRRAELFIDDPRFEVTVVSTYNYTFENATNVLLTAARQPVSAPAETSRPVARLIPEAVRGALRLLLNLIALPFELRTMARDLALLRETVARVKPDVVLLQTLQYPSFLAYRLPAELPMVVTFWNGDLTYFAKWTGLEMLLKKRMVVHGLRRVDAITVNSQTAFDAGVSLGGDPAKMMLVRYPGADLERFKPGSRADARRRLNIIAHHVLLCPRGLGIFFNSDIIVRAAARVATHCPDLLVLFVSGVGGTEEWERHLRLAESLGIADRMRWDGQIPWENMPSYYVAADVMVSVKTADSCPNCMLEAMACGIPVIMSDTQQNQEWIEDGRNGFLCPPRDPAVIADRISAVLKDQEGLVDQFARICLDKIRRDANSAINVARIKDLVAGLAARGGRH